MDRKKLFYFSLIAFTIIILDRITKSWALGLSHQQFLNSYISFGLTFNRGINWGFFSAENSLQYTIINGIIVLVILGMLYYTYLCWRQRQSILPNMLVLAGALSNYYDRIMHGGVIDFIILSYQQWSWPAFNVADAAIVTGIGLLLLAAIRNR
jgi:signal peptidase II